MKNKSILLLLVLVVPLTYLAFATDYVAFDSNDNENIITDSLTSSLKDYKDYDIEYVHEFNNFEKEYPLPDPVSFEYLLTDSGVKTTLYKDKDYVYITGQENGVIQALAYVEDPATFELLAYLSHACESQYDDFQCEEAWPTKVIYAKDNTSVYAFSGISGPPRKVVGADVDTFKVVKTKDGKSTVYARDKNNIYFGPQKIDADFETFTAKSISIGSDSQGIFYDGLRQ